MQETQDMKEIIGQSAGQIWQYLNDKGEVTVNKMKKELDLENNFAELGLGWLAREEKVEFTKGPRSVKVRLR